MAADEMSRDRDMVEAADKGQAISGYETLTLWQTARQFRWASIYCFIAAMSAAADGYQLSYVAPSFQVCSLTLSSA